MVGTTEGTSDTVGVIELSADDLVEVDEDRAGLLVAANAARDISMLTGTHGVVAPPLQRPRVRLPEADEIHAGTLPNPENEEIGRLRARVQTRSGDTIGELRARLELARAELEHGNDEAARREANLAVQTSESSPAARAMLRTLLAGRAEINDQIAHVEKLIGSATRSITRADWLCEKARLLEARDGVTDASIQIWKDALALVPDHVGGLYGLEVALDRGKRHSELANMLGDLSNLVKDREHSAWLLVERAMLLDRYCGDNGTARAAFTRALELSPGLGPVRSACVDYAVRHRDDAALSELLESEAQLEPDRLRAARLDLDAALSGVRAGVPRDRILAILERAHGRAPTTPFLDARIADELARIYDQEARHLQSMRARIAILKTISDPREELVYLRLMAMSAVRAGAVDEAVLALERSIVLDPEDSTHIEDLDAVLASAKRHDDRARLWLREAARVEAPAKKARALLHAAGAAREGGDEAEAQRHREAAWLTAPTAPGVYDAMVAEIPIVSPGGEVIERIALYERTVTATNDVARKIHLLEKVAWLKDDVAGDIPAAVATYEEILALEPTRLSAILGLGSVAERGGDARALAKSLALQADVTKDPLARAELRLRSAEVLAAIDRERALALAEELRRDPKIAEKAAEVVTRIHLSGGRWEAAASVLAQRADAAADLEETIALGLKEASIHLGRLRSPERALDALARLPKTAVEDAGVRAAMIDALEVLGDDERLREELIAMAGRTSAPVAKASLLVRAAELEEQRNEDEAAVRAYQEARAALPVEPLIDERIRRIGARTTLPASAATLVSPRETAMRALELIPTGSAEPLLASGARDIATLRLAERIARRNNSGPQLANALILTAAGHPNGVLAIRAYEGLAALVTWTLPVADDDEPWLRLLSLGSSDIVVLDTLVRRMRRHGDEPNALAAATTALLRRVDTAADDTEQLLLRLDLARFRRRGGAIPEAGLEAKKALAIDPTSLSAACLLMEIAAELDDDEAAIAASRALATIVTKPETKAELLRDAADLSIERGDKDLAATLYEDALRADPENVQIAARLASHQRSRGATRELGRALDAALSRAKSPEAILPMASELADVARLELRDPLLAISALERLRQAIPNHVPSLFLLSELFIGQRAWDKALVALADAGLSSHEKNNKLVALNGRASIYRRVLDQPKLAATELRSALQIDDFDPRTIRNLLDLGEGVDAEERAVLLGRFVSADIPPLDRMRALLELSEARRAINDLEGAEGALVEAASLTPETWMFDHVRTAVGGDQDTFARILSKAVARAHENGRTLDPSWLIGLGAVELELHRNNEASERFEEALRIDATRDDARVYLARALVARDQSAPAALALMTVLNAPARRVAVDVELIRQLQSALAGAGRPTEEWVARELRGLAGDLGPGEQVELDTNIATAARTESEGLTSPFLRSSLVPHGFGRHPVWDVAQVTSGFAGKMARIGLSEQGSSTRERVKPKTQHPLRYLFDRMLRAFGMRPEEVELAVSDHTMIPLVACEDLPWVVIPSSLQNAPDAYAVAALARPFTRIALGVPWLGALVPNEVIALLVGVARLVAPGFSARPADRIEQLVDDYSNRARKAIDRKRRRTLEEMEPTLSSAAPFDEALFTEAVVATEARAAYLLSGSLRAALDMLGLADPPVADAIRVPTKDTLEIVFGRQSSRDLAAFALSSDSASLRRGILRN